MQATILTIHGARPALGAACDSAMHRVYLMSVSAIGTVVPCGTVPGATACVSAGARRPLPGHSEGRVLASLSQTRCFNHVQREAVARCPSCRRHFCRECVTEHDHRLLCVSCIASLPEEAGRERRFGLPFRAASQLAGSLVVLWLAFYVVGQALLLVPSEFHDTYDTLAEEAGLDDSVGAGGGGNAQ